MAVNGRLPDSVLAPIAGGRLIKSAAASWNAMNARLGGALRPMGSMSSYRTYSQQVYLWNNVPHAHNRAWVAYPGTSNHGWGLAVDLGSHYMRSLIDQRGAAYGWAKKWSDAPVEWWHIRYRSGIWNGKVPNVYPTLRKGTTNHKAVKLAKRLLKDAHFAGFKYNGSYNRAARSAVKRFQKKHHLHADGVVGPSTWKALLKYRR